MQSVQAVTQCVPLLNLQGGDVGNKILPKECQHCEDKAPHFDVLNFLKVVMLNLKCKR